MVFGLAGAAAAAALYDGGGAAAAAGGGACPPYNRRADDAPAIANLLQGNEFAAAPRAFPAAI